MNKQDVVAAVARSSGISKASADDAVDAIFGAITDALRKGEDVRLVGFGTFPPAGARPVRAEIPAPVKPSRSRRPRNPSSSLGGPSRMR